MKTKGRRKLGNTDIESFSSELDYIFHRPELSIGSVQTTEKSMFTYTDAGALFETKTMVNDGLMKIIDEVISNSIDEAVKSDFTSGTIIKVTLKNGYITVRDNGRGIPVQKDSVSKKWIPELVLTQLRTGRNFDDDSNDKTMGKHGVGVSLTNAFSDEFTVETCDGQTKYSQVFQKNMSKIAKPKTRNLKKRGKTFTEISFHPSYDYFIKKTGTTNPFATPADDFETDLLVLIRKRLTDLAFIYPQLSFHFQGKKITRPVPKKMFADMDSKFAFFENDNVAIGVMINDYDKQEFQHVSFVNGCETKDGTHVEVMSNSVAYYIQEHIKKKYKFDVSFNHIKKYMFMFISIKIPNPTFDHQTKTRLDTPWKKYEKKLGLWLTDAFLKKVFKNDFFIGIITEVHKLQKESKERKQVKNASKRAKNIAKFIPAQSNRSDKNILLIGEGDSALSFFEACRTKYQAAYPVRGKINNVYEMSNIDLIKKKKKTDSDNDLVTLMQLIGLTIGEPAHNLNYSMIGILSDQDHDGNAICGLFLNFFYKYWKELFDMGMIVRVLSPLYIAKKGGKTKRFYNHEDYQSAKLTGWDIKYNKGLGSLSEDEYRHMLHNPMYLQFNTSQNTDSMMNLVYCKDAELRRDWLSDAVS